IIIAAKQNNIKKLLNVTSSCMYPRNAQNPLKEEAILTGELEPTNEGYAIAKIFSQRLCSYIVSEDTSFMYKTIIPCNLYGKWDKFDENNSHMIPAVIKKVYNAKKNNTNVEIWGSGKARREFMYASDFAEFIWYGVNNFNKMPFLMNVGLGKDYTINEYYNVISKVIGFNGKFINNTSKPEGMKQKLVDISKQIEFGWMPKYSLEEGIKETYKYFLENVNN
ncbi:MAG TPA: NAD-dependent epimerase/dehydratase family protein, partial [Bacteroidales bacterium]|nr:NAD-dependent epimerase/dehydratase family protein [Bacteroidales bacterium]